MCASRWAAASASRRSAGLGVGSVASYFCKQCDSENDNVPAAETGSSASRSHLSKSSGPSQLATISLPKHIIAKPLLQIDGSDSLLDSATLTRRHQLRPLLVPVAAPSVTQASTSALGRCKRHIAQPSSQHRQPETQHFCLLPRIPSSSVPTIVSLQHSDHQSPR